MEQIYLNPGKGDITKSITVDGKQGFMNMVFHIKNQLQEDIISDQISIKEYKPVYG